MRIGVVGEWGSSNLGDRIIGSCVELELRDLGHELVLIDLSGRTGGVDFAGSRIDFTRDRQVPQWMSQAKAEALWRLRGARRLQQYLRNALAGLDYVLIGGGQLLGDRMLNFPRKIHLLAGLMRDGGLRYSFISCGVGEFSARGARLVRPALDRADRIGVRDAASVDRLNRQFTGLESRVLLMPDAAFRSRRLVDTIAESNPTVSADSGGGHAVGIGVIHKSRVEPYVDHVRDWTPAQYLDFWMSIVRKYGSTASTTVFTNGDVRDNAFAEDLTDALRNEGVKVDLVRPERYQDLLLCIAEMGTVVAARLHALIPAASLGKRVYGIAWDNKVNGVMTDLGLSSKTIEMSLGESDGSTLGAADSQYSSDQVLTAADRLSQLFSTRLRQILAVANPSGSANQDREAPSVSQ